MKIGSALVGLSGLKGSIMRRRENYKFTNKKHPVRAVASTILGVIALMAYTIAIFLTYKNHGDAAPQLGISGLLGLIYACIGLYLGIASRLEKDKFYLFCYVGMVLNLLVLILAGFTVYLGVKI